MAPPSPLSGAFLAALPEPLRAEAAGLSDLEGALGEALAAARAAWPDLAVAPEVFAAHVAERLPIDMPLERSLRLEQAADLYLACACAQGDAAAVGAFEQRYLREIDGALAHLDLAGAVVKDVKQMVRERLLVGDGQAPGKIRDYTGRGDLGSWVRVIAVRVALGLMRRGKKEVAVADAELMGVPAAADDPELAHMKALYRDEFRAAFGEALQALTHRQRNLLRHHFLHGLSIDQIGGLYRVHRATAARWIGKARDALLAETRRRLTKRLKVSREEFDSIMRLIQSRLDVSIHQFLASKSE